ncbi:uncharacterized protein VP01_779g1 [Puccinia sorghi]|uniref:Long chronological lifespan protein 2 n=1 Tax=Puccinia sorghi TaxID=27349 RepID=A0A0L6UB66_9BASI|nr:uncharacterized protein VP01_779g1 [Puccinia sorghi]
MVRGGAVVLAVMLAFLVHSGGCQFGNIFEASLSLSPDLSRREESLPSPFEHPPSDSQSLLSHCITFLAFVQQFFQQDDPGNHPNSSPQGGPDKFVLLRDQSRCAQYLCPSTFDCVAAPADCPCPFVEDIKCPFSPPPSASASLSSLPKSSPSYVCTRAPGCENVQRALSFGS